MNRAWGADGGAPASGTAGARPDEARRHNRAALLRRLHVDGPCTRATLATELGLNRSTIKAVVDGLAEAGVVTEAVPAQRTGAGRPSLMVLPEPQAAVVLAVDVRVEQVAMSMVGIGGQVLGRHSWNLHRRTRTPGEVITHVAESAQLLAEELAVTARGAGVSVPGVVRRDDGGCTRRPTSAGATSRWAPGWQRCCGCRCRWPTTPSWARWPSTCAASPADVDRPRLHLRRRRGGRRGDLRAGGRCAAPAATSARSATSSSGRAGGPATAGPAGCWETEVGEEALLPGARAAGGHPARGGGGRAALAGQAARVARPARRVRRVARHRAGHAW